uniref:Uncharacterized protein n=1 Tax=Cereibacter sphaeroides (strain ATCC 17025 / ATH 2.4.3) TaxID=349102 RepID=A4WZ91_CERS5
MRRSARKGCSSLPQKQDQWVLTLANKFTICFSDKDIQPWILTRNIPDKVVRRQCGCIPVVIRELYGHLDNPLCIGLSSKADQSECAW